MTEKTAYYVALAEEAAKQITGSREQWTAFLTTAARLYKYPFNEQLMIYKQRPDATACAEYDLWNDTMRRYVKRGSKGIALLDTSGDTIRLRYVFDVSDTGARRNSRPVNLWTMRDEYIPAVTERLSRAFDIGDDEGTELSDVIEAVAKRMAAEYWDDHREQILDIVDDSFLYGYDELNVSVSFRRAAETSIRYMLLTRCVEDVGDYFEPEDFMDVFDFNTQAAANVLGTAVSEVSGRVFREIERAIRTYERGKAAERSQNDDRTDLQTQRGLPDSEYLPGRDHTDAPGQVRQDAPGLSSGEQYTAVQSPDSYREAVPAPAGDSDRSGEPDGADHGRTAESEPRTGQENPAARLGAAYERTEGTGRGSDSGGTYQQLTLDLLFPTEAEQIQAIDEAENVKASSAFSFAQADIDHVLRLGGNTDRERERIVAAFEEQKPIQEIAAYLQTLYHGGNGIGGVTAWYDADGIHLSHGKSARYDQSAQVISWESAAERIGQLLEEGRFASNVELAEAAGYERTRLAEQLWNLYHDLTDDAKDRNLLSVMQDVKDGGFQEQTEHLANLLTDTGFRSLLAGDLQEFLNAYHAGESVLRFRYHKPGEIWESLHDLDRPRRTFSTEMAEVPAASLFITEDEIDAAITGGSGVSGGKGRIYTFFQERHTDKEKTAFLRQEYGTGGRSHALSGATHSGEDHDGKGLHYKKQDCPEVHLTWEKVSRRIAGLIQAGRYLTEQEQAEYDKIQEEKALAEADAMDVQQAFSENVPETALQGQAIEETYPKLHELLRPHSPEEIAAQEPRPYQVVVYHHFENGFDEKMEYSSLEEAEKAAQGYVDGTLEPDGFAYDGAAVYDLAARQYLRIYGNYPDEEAHAQLAQSRDAIREQTPADPAAPAYSVGDTVYLEGDAYQIMELRNDTVQLLPPGMVYPVYRAESRERFEQLLRQDSRNATFVDFLADDPNKTDQDLRDVLVHGLIGPSDRAEIVKLLSSGKGNGDIAQWLSTAYPNIIETMELETGDTADYRTMTEGIELEVLDADEKRLAMLFFRWDEIAPILRGMYQRSMDGIAQEEPKAPTEPPAQFREEAETVYPGEKNGLPYDIVVERLHVEEPEPPAPAAEPEKTLDEVLDEHPISIQVNGEWQTFPNVKAAEEASFEEYKANLRRNAENFHITDDHLGEGGPKAKFQANIAAIRLLKELEERDLPATAEQQEVLSRYVGWGGLADAFDPDKGNWAQEYATLKSLLTEEEYTTARASTLNAHYTSPTVIRAIYEAVGQMGFQSGNILEPAMGVGNFFGMLPDSMRSSRLYGVELDSISGRIAQKLYPQADIKVAGFETTDRRDFYDLAVGNIPFGNYRVADKPYDKLGFTIHNYFFAKALDQVRPGGIVAFVTSRYTMDAKNTDVRQYLAQRAELLGAIRLPNNAFKANAGTEVVSDIIFLQKRDRPIDIEPAWVHLGLTSDNIPINSYFLEHPEMVLGQLSTENTQYGREEATVEPIPGADLGEQLKEAISHIHGHYERAELAADELLDAKDTIPADPSVKNFSYAVVNGEVYFRENSIMRHMDLSDSAKGRVSGMVELRRIVGELIDYQLEDYPDEAIRQKQAELNAAYDAFYEKYGTINSRANAKAFAEDSSYYLLCSLENIDEDGNLESKAEMFTKRTIRPEREITRVDTPSEALAVSIGQRGHVDLAYMSELLGTPGEYDAIIQELKGVIFRDPLEMSKEDVTKGWHTADDYLSGNVRAKLQTARLAAETDPSFAVNVSALERAQPKDLDASEIDVRLGATWIDPQYIQQFMEQTFEPPFYMRHRIQVQFSPLTAEWQISGKSMPNTHDVAAYTTYGTLRANAYRILEDTLNLRDVRIYDTVEDADGKQKRVLNKKETTLAQQKQQAIKDAFRDWVWKDPRRREALVRRYNELFNSTRPREYDGSHIQFGGMNPDITLREHQRGAIAHVLYGGNTLLAHEVGAGKTFEMAASAMEAKRLGLCQKSMFVVPNHLTMQWANEFLRLYPSAKILVATKRDFETARRKKFCARIATGNYDAVIIGHSQFEKIPISAERQERLLREQIEEIEQGIEDAKRMRGESFTIKQMEKTRKSLQARLDKLLASDRKDDVITFEQLGVDRLFVDEAHAFKNLFLFTKMRNVAGLSTSEAQKSSDMFMKCRYMDELTGGRGVVFATGTPVSNSMTELYTMMRYLQYSTLQQKGLSHFDCWASTFGETTTAIELAPEGTGYRARTRFAKFFNLPELMSMFKEVADIKTADQLHLPVPEAKFETVVVQPSEHQRAMVAELSERAAAVHSGVVDPSADNMLKITSDGRKLGLDQRLMNPLLPDDPDSKLNACVRNVLRIWEEGKDEKLTQLLFCDLSIPKGDGSFNVYEDIREKLLAAGVPREEIAFIHDADTEARKKELFAKVRSGQVRVLLGSTQKMGAGTNVQDRLVAVHHLDVGWRPADMTQRNGRIIRQGNRNQQVQVYQYVTEGTFDAYLYQTLENKQKFISQIMTSKSPVRSCDDVDEQALSYAEIKALCAGNPLIKEKMDLDVEVARLKVLRADFQSQHYRLEDQLLKYFPAEIERQHGLIRGFEQDMQIAAAHPTVKDGFVGMEVGGTHFTEKELAGDAILAACRQFKGEEPQRIGSYRGFSMELSFDSFNKEFQLTLKGNLSHRITLGTDARGNLTRMDNALANIPQRLEDAREKLATLVSQQEAARQELEKAFPHETELAEKSARLAELDALLSMEEAPTGHDDRENSETEEVVESRPSVLADLKSKAEHLPPTRNDRPIREEVL